MIEARADRSYHLREFLAYDGAAFVEGCYRALLGRAPVPAGLEFERLLAAGTAKVEIVGRIRYSAEGRAYGARVRGLTILYVFELAGHVPLVGYAVRALQAALLLPRSQVEMRNLRQGLVNATGLLGRIELEADRFRLDVEQLREDAERLRADCARLWAEEPETRG